MVAGESGSLTRWICQLRQSPSEPYKDAVYHSSLQYAKGRSCGSSINHLRRIHPLPRPQRQSFNKDVRRLQSPMGSRSSSECSSEHLDLPNHLRSSLAALATSSSSNATLPSRSDVTLPSLPSTRSSSLSHGKVQKSSATIGMGKEHGSLRTGYASPRSEPARATGISASPKSVTVRSNGGKAVSPNEQSTVQLEATINDNESELDRSSLSSGSEASTIAQHSSEAGSNRSSSTPAPPQSLQELQQYVHGIKEDNRALSANLQNLRGLIEQQTDNLKRREEESRGSMLQQLQQVREHTEQQSRTLEDLGASGGELGARIATLEESRGLLVGDLETRLGSRISSLEESGGRVAELEARFGQRVSAVEEESRKQVEALEERLSGRIDSLEQHLRATNTTAAL